MTDSEKVPQGTTPVGELEDEIRRLAVDGRISCRAAFGLAERRGMSISDLGGVLDDLGTKIVACQLGCFK